jgi:RNA polymerase sigma-70 factor (ECF subfamily)
MFFNKYKKFEKEALKHMDSLYYLALKFTRDESKASDLLQESYLKAFKNYKSFKEDTNMKAWLSRILTNTFINDYRKRKKEKFVFSYDDNEDMYYNWYEDSIKTSTSNPEKNYFFKELGEEINKALEELPEDSRIIVLYADFYEFSYKDISETLDIPIGTVMSRLYRARKMLHSKLYKQAKSLGLIDGKKKKESKIINFAV